MFAISNDCCCAVPLIVGRSKGDDPDYRFLKDNPPAKDLTKDGKNEILNSIISKFRGILILLITIFHEECERIIISLLIADVLHPNVVYTAYSTVCYIRLGPKGRMLLTALNPTVTVSFPTISAVSQSTLKKSPRTSLAIADDDGWISRNKTKLENKVNKKAHTRIPSYTKTKQKTKQTDYRPSVKTKKILPKTDTKTNEMSKTFVEIDSLSSGSSEEEVLTARRVAAVQKRKRNIVLDGDWSSDGSSNG